MEDLFHPPAVAAVVVPGFLSDFVDGFFHSAHQLQAHAQHPGTRSECQFLLVSISAWSRLIYECLVYSQFQNNLFIPPADTALSSADSSLCWFCNF